MSNSPRSKAAAELTQILNNPKKLEEVKIFVTSWNMGNAEPQGFMDIFNEKNALESFDIFALGLQESTYPVGGISISNASGTHESINHFQNFIKDNFDSNEFFIVDHCYRAQLQLYLIARKSLKGRITDIETSIENTGFLHVFPNKGGLLITFKLDGTRLAFISCHLTAHEGVEHCEERNTSIVEILGGVRAGDKNIDITEQFHHVFWMGDMNYRLTFDPRTPKNVKKNIDASVASKRQVARTTSKMEDIKVELNDDTKGGAEKDAMDDDESSDEDEDAGASSGDKKKEWQANRKKVLDMIVKEQWKELMNYDELNREIAANRVLNGFTALQPSFPPTFKRIRGEKIQAINTPSQKWNLRRTSSAEDSSEKTIEAYYHHKRIPSYTDRILFKSLPTFENWCSSLFFESCEAANSSDHKPVRAGFNLYLSEGDADILVDRQLLGKVKKPAESRNKEPKFIKMQIFDLKGFELEEMDAQMFGGGSDPYIVVTTDPPNLLLNKNQIRAQPTSVKSKVIKHNLNPVWEDPLYLTLASSDLEGLSRNASLIVQVWDEDLYNPDDLIGCVTIPFKEILESAFVSRRPYVFEKFLRCNSEVMGRIAGRIILDGDYIRTEEDAKILANERKNRSNPTFLTLKEAVLEAAQADSNGCCTIN